MECYKHLGQLFFGLPSLDLRTAVLSRLESELRSQPKWREVDELMRVARKVPFLSAVAVTGSVAMNQAVLNDDLDFLIVTQPGALWIVRPLVSLIAWLKGKRRSWSREEGNSWCFNLWLESDRLTIDESRRCTYTAYELCQAEWVWDSADIARKMYRSNSWAATYLPNFFQERQIMAPAVGLVETDSLLARPTFSPGRWLIRLINRALFIAQSWYMAGHHTNEDVSAQKAFFHPRDTRGLVHGRWLDLVRLWALSVRYSGQCVLATGVFDVLHEEHKLFLSKSAELARRYNLYLVVGVESDVRVRAMKGRGRPINSQLLRRQKLQDLGIADAVFVLPEKFDVPDDRRALLRALAPKYLALSAHTAHREAKSAMMAEIGGEAVVVHEHNPAVSTTLLVSSAAYDTTKAQGQTYE